MIETLWIKIFFLAYFCIVGLAIGIDSRYYAKYFKDD